MELLPQDIKQKVFQRNILRKNGEYKKADSIRDELLKLGYIVNDKNNESSEIIRLSNEKKDTSRPGTMIIFGSGELSTVGRNIHERAIKDKKPPVKICLLETPAGYEDNPHNWYLKLKNMMEKGLSNYKPEITLIPALRKDGERNTNDPKTLSPLLTADYIHTGAGSPTYAVKHLQNTLAIKMIKQQLMAGVSVSIASAVALAFGKYTIPVYEIYFAGHDPSWIDGLDFFSEWKLNLTFIPHWNNTEGGADIDTRFAYMGEKRIKKLISILPGQTTILGIDEHTALKFDFVQKKVDVLGKGTVTIRRQTNKRIVRTGETFTFDEL